MKFLGFITLIFFATGSKAQITSSDIENTWLLAQEGCDLTLNSDQIDQLFNGSQHFVYYVSILRIDKIHYSKNNFKSRRCQPGDSGLLAKKDNEDIRLYCGKELLTEGTYTVYNNNIKFTGYVIQHDGSLHETLGIHSEVGTTFELKNGALILEHTNSLICRPRKLISYYIPYSLS